MVGHTHSFKALSKISPKTILVIGDLILDQYTYGVSKRISPEAPVPVVLVERSESKAGGVGNVASISNSTVAFNQSNEAATGKGAGIFVDEHAEERVGRLFQRCLLKVGID